MCRRGSRCPAGAGRSPRDGRPHGARRPGLQAAPGPGIRAGPSPARALWRLAHVYAAENFLVSARDTLSSAPARYPRIRFDDAGQETPLAELVTCRARPCPPGPGRRRPPPAARALSPGRKLATPGAEHSDGASRRRPRACLRGWSTSRTFLVEGTKLSPLDPRTGQPRWSADMGAPAVWVGYLADKLLAATSQRVVALDLNGGAEQWRFAQGSRRRPRRGPDPFARPEPASANADRRAGPAPRFPAGRRPAVLPAGRRGAPRAGRRYGGGRLVLLAAGQPDQSQALDRPGTGRAPGPVAQPACWCSKPTADARSPGPPWPKEKRWNVRPVPMDEDHVLLVTDRRTVKKFDMTRGQFTWDYRESLEMPVNGPPRVMVDAERVLVLHDGKKLIRLDPVNGSRRWSAVLGIEDLSERPDAIACDEKRVYCVSRAEPPGPVARRWPAALELPPERPGELPVVDRAGRAVRRGLSPRSRSGRKTRSRACPSWCAGRTPAPWCSDSSSPRRSRTSSLRLDARGALLATSRALWALAERRVGPDVQPGHAPLNRDSQSRNPDRGQRTFPLQPR